MWNSQYDFCQIAGSRWVYNCGQRCVQTRRMFLLRRMAGPDQPSTDISSRSKFDVSTGCLINLLVDFFWKLLDGKPRATTVSLRISGSKVLSPLTDLTSRCNWPRETLWIFGKWLNIEGLACQLTFKVENLSEGVELLWRKYEDEVRKNWGHCHLWWLAIGWLQEILHIVENRWRWPWIWALPQPPSQLSYIVYYTLHIIYYKPHIIHNYILYIIHIKCYTSYIIYHISYTRLHPRWRWSWEPLQRPGLVWAGGR